MTRAPERAAAEGRMRGGTAGTVREGVRRAEGATFRR